MKSTGHAQRSAMTLPFRARLQGTPLPMHRWKGADGNDLCGDSWGVPSDQCIVFLHGGGQTRHSWRSTARRMADAGFYTVAIDARGHGDSDWVSNGDYSEMSMAKDLACIVRSVGGKPVLIGASLGGITSLVAVGNKLLDAKALVLADVAHVTARDGFNRVSEFMTRFGQGFETLDEAAQAVGAYRGESRPAGSNQGLAKNLRKDVNGRLYWHWDPRFVLGRSEDLDARNRRLRDCVQKIAVPTLLVRGARSDVVTDEAVAEFLALCPNASRIDIAGAGHMLTGDDNDAFGTVTAEFIHSL